MLVRSIFSFFLVLSLTFDSFAGTSAPEPFAGLSKDGKGAVASVNPLATQIGLDILSEGGNAVDAAIAVAFALGVVDSHNSGIGGGCFIVARLANGDILAIDGREIAPALAHRDMYIREGELLPELSKTGALASGIPGSVLALYELQKAGGKLNYSDVIAPSIPLAENGFPVDKNLAKRLSRAHDSLAKFPASKAIFINEEADYKAGEILVQKDLARTYGNLAQYGPDYFYKGKFAASVEEWMKQNSGIITAKDFANYRTLRRTPVRSDFHGYEIYGFPPPSSGGTHVSQLLTMFDMLDLEKKDESERYHLMIEASKLAFADRAYWMGDSDFVPVPKGLITREYLQQRIKEISETEVSVNLQHGTPADYEKNIFTKHTTHISTADEEGNWVAITTTLNTSFGSKVVIPGTGVLMNNQMDDFSAKPGAPNAFGLVGNEANAIAPFKRPLSSMSPTIVMKNDKPVLAVGAAGGPTIISQVAQTIFNYLALGMELDEALSAVRVHHQWRPDRVFIDGFASEKLQKSLEEKGHALSVWPRFGATQAVGFKEGKLQAESEPRIQ